LVAVEARQEREHHIGLKENGKADGQKAVL
jgi:hypothetical protein